MPLKGPFLTIKLITSYRASAAAMVVCSALVSYAGATSTMSAAIMLMPSRPRRIVRSSRVDQPPVSGVPVAGATTIVSTRNRKEEVSLTGWIKSVDVNGQIHRLGSSNSLVDLLDDAIHANCINLSGLHNLKPAVSIIFIVARTAQRGTDTSVDVSIVGEQSFLRSMVEVCAVVDAGNLAW